MFELLGMLGGGVFRLVPFIVDFFKQRQDQAHELEMGKLQLDIDKARAQQAIDLAHSQADIALAQGEMDTWRAAVDAQSKPTGVGWIDAISASVRPVLTYYWCIGLYGGAKIIQILVAYQTNQPLDAYIPILITEFDRTVIGSVLSFWFVDRSLRKLGK